LTGNVELLKQTNESGMLFDAMLDLAHVAGDAPDQQYVQDALSQIEHLPELRATTENRIVRQATVQARLLRRLGRIPEASAVITTALDAARREPSVSPRLRESLFAVASLVARDTGSSEAVFEYELAALEASRLARGDHPDSQLLITMISAADGAIEVGNFSQAEAILLEAEPILMENFGINSLMHARILSAQGRLRFAKGDYHKAIPDLRMAVDILRDCSSFNRSEMAAPLLHLAQAAYFLGHYREAMDSIREAYEIDLQQFGSDHPETLYDAMIMEGLAIMAVLDGIDDTYWKHLPINQDIRRRIDDLRRPRN
jgi:tetratricopeptide (TPR) repeat protein